MDADERLYIRVQAGDREAMAEIVDRYQRPLLQFLYRMTSLEQTAEDLTQETFLRMLVYTGHPPERFRSWAYTIACNLARDNFRRAANRLEVTDPMDEGLADHVIESAETTAVRLAEAQSAANTVLSLPLPLREVLVLRFYHELRLEEISEITGRPVGTVKSRLYRSLRCLKEQLSQEESTCENNQ